MGRPFLAYAALHLLALAALLTLLFAWPREAAAQAMCMPTAEFQRQIAANGESEIGLGVADTVGAAVVRFFAAPGGSTFTIIVTTPTGVSCLVAVGRDLDIAPPPVVNERKS